MRAVWGENSVAIPGDFQPGVLILCRQFLNIPSLRAHVERLIKAGWVVVTDIDDDPTRWREYGQVDMVAFRGVHAVSVSTEPLAEVIRTFNPNVTVFGNAIFEIPRLPERQPIEERKVRIFFGALNRVNSWDSIKGDVLPVLEELKHEIEFVVVHEREIYDSLPQDLHKQFYPTLGHAQYIEKLSSCDIALLPLMDNQFNRLKSDLKVIECCSVSVVPIYSDVMYPNTVPNGTVGVMVGQGESWGIALRELVRNTAKIAEFSKAGLAWVKAERMHCHAVSEREKWLNMLRSNAERLERERITRLKEIGWADLVNPKT
jgi:hypothetical protein